MVRNFRCSRVMSIRKPRKAPMMLSIRKRAIFRKVKEIKNLSGGVVLYAAQSNPQVDAEVAGKGRFRTKTRIRAVPIRKPREAQQFSIRKRGIFRKVKEIKDLSGGVVLYAAQSNPQVDAEIAEKGRFRTKTRVALFLLALVFTGCAAEKKVAPQPLAQKEAIREIALFPVGFTKDYRMLGWERAPYPVDIRDDLRKRVARNLEEMGYTVVPVIRPEDPLPEGTDAAMRVLIDFFIYDAWEPDRTGLIQVHAIAELESPSGKSLWKDEASARTEELGKPLGFVYPHAETLRVLSRLADRLVDSLPAAGESG